MTTFTPTAREPRRTLEVDSSPKSRRTWLADQWSHRAVLGLLARSNFNARYKRVTFGVLWAVAIPVLQAAALAFVFSHFIRTHGHFSYAAFAVAGVLAWGYFNPTVTTASTAIVDGAGMTDKVWFPRSMLVFVPCLANIPAMVISLILLIVSMPILGASYGLHTLLFIPAALLLISFTASLALVLSAVHVYFRDVRYLVQAAMLVMFYITPVAYTALSIGSVGKYQALNPLTGLVNVFQLAAVGRPDQWSPNSGLAIAITLATNVLLLVIAVELHRRRDRLFVDRL